MRCVCVWLGAAWVEKGGVDEMIGFGIYQFCGNRGSIWLRWCRWGVGRGLGPVCDCCDSSTACRLCRLEPSSLVVQSIHRLYQLPCCSSVSLCDSCTHLR